LKFSKIFEKHGEKANTRDNNLYPSGMSENSSKSKPPMSEEIKESKENFSKGVNQSCQFIWKS
jgi:hypothetical protein